MTELDLFDEEWYNSTYPDVALSKLSPFDHYIRIGSKLGRRPNPNFEVDVAKPLPKEIEETVSKESASIDPVLPFDEAYYLLNQFDIAAAGVNGQEHFNDFGYLELRNPRSDFDLVWYNQNYLLGTSDENANGLEHYNRVGAEKGYLPKPPLPVQFDKSYSKILGKSPRRICLFAAYDPDGIIDDYALDYIRDMARHADVYYLADCAMDPTEMHKLDGLVKGAWAERHGAYDFGSYSRLARDLVGWETIETYDELIFANDSCYLVHPLEETFQEMAKRPCAWWGLQATKGLISTMHQNNIPADAPVPISEIKEEHLDRFEADKIYDFLVGSYFLAFRKNVICDLNFRRVLDNVSAETNKLNIIRKYEIGLTRFLIGHGYEFDTLVDIVSRQHPIFSERAFDLIDDGFPLLKRYFLTDNHYRIKGLAQWKSRVLQANPDADIASFEKNLYRVGDAEKLYRNFRIGQNPSLSRSPRSNAQMKQLDLSTPKYDHWWAFPVCRFSNMFSDNTRAVFERVKNDPNIKKIILTRGTHVDVGGINVVVVPLQSYEGQTYLLRARQVFLRHGVKTNIGYPLSSDLHNFHNLWHGIPLKRIGYASLDQLEKLPALNAEHKRLKSVISASDVDRLAMTAAYYPLTYNDIWVTGLPRHDWILAAENDLPDDFKIRISKLKSRLNGKKFILFAPTFRSDQENGYYSFTKNEVQQLSNWLLRNGIIMGIREHMADKTRLYSSQLRGDAFIDVSERHYPDIEVLYRHADILLTDYSSAFIDFMLTKRPMVSFAYDKENYASTQRGLFYDMEAVFPGPICTDYPALMEGLKKSHKRMSKADQHAYDTKVDFFHKYRDTHNSDRVIEKVKEGYEGSQLVWNRPSTTGFLQKKKTVTFVYSQTHQTTNRYRIFNLMEHLSKLGWVCRAVIDRLLTPQDLMHTEVMVICRIPMTETIIDFCETHRLNGGKIVVAVDDLMHDMNIFSQSEHFRKNPELASDLIVSSEDTHQMIEAADAITVTTLCLAESMYAFGKQVEIVPNSIPTSLSKKYTSPVKSDALGDKIRICFISGTTTHSDDFAECRDALVRVLKRYPEAELHVVGAFDADKTIETFIDIDCHYHGLMPYEALHEFIRGMDINLAPLANTEFNDCKSEVKIFEAALHGVVSIASPTHSYAAIIEHDSNGLLANTSGEWEAALERLITDAPLRHRLGTAAFEQIASQFSAIRSAQILNGFLSELIYSGE